DDLVRPSGGAEGKPQARLVAQFRREAVVATDAEHRRRPPLVPPLRQPRGKARAVEILAALVEHDADRTLRDHIGDGDRFLDPALADIGRAAFANLDDVRAAKADAPPGLIRALAIGLGKLALRAVVLPADCGHHDPHGPLPGSAQHLRPHHALSQPAVWLWRLHHIA